jgi:hypothetical protein
MDSTNIKTPTVNPERTYSLTEAQTIVGVKVRARMRKYVEDGQLLAVKIGNGPSGGTRYAIKGEHIISFKAKYDRGMLQTERYSVEETKMILNLALAFAKEHNLTTLADVNNKLKELK